MGNRTKLGASMQRPARDGSRDAATVVRSVQRRAVCHCPLPPLHPALDGTRLFSGDLVWLMDVDGLFVALLREP
jgi:hypothetical protein